MTAGPGDIDSFIARWQGREGGQERANYACSSANFATRLV
jgi:hypothetical protein